MRAALAMVTRPCQLRERVCEELSKAAVGKIDCENENESESESENENEEATCKQALSWSPTWFRGCGRGVAAGRVFQRR